MEGRQESGGLGIFIKVTSKLGKNQLSARGEIYSALSLGLQISTNEHTA